MDTLNRETFDTAKSNYLADVADRNADVEPDETDPGTSFDELTHAHFERVNVSGGEIAGGECWACSTENGDNEVVFIFDDGGFFVEPRISMDRVTEKALVRAGICDA